MFLRWLGRTIVLVLMVWIICAGLGLFEKSARQNPLREQFLRD